MRRRTKGVGLGVTLVIVALLAVVGFTLAALTVGRLQLLGNLQHKRYAHRLAMSAIQAALSKLAQQPQYGVTGNDPPILVSSEEPNNRGRLTFSPAQTDIPQSINNLAGLTAVQTPYNVPAASARLVAEGRYGSSRELVEALITQPVFPFALACHGSIHSTQGLIVATLAEDTAAARQNLLSDPARYGRPANLLSNGTDISSVQILGPSTICGDLQTSGRVDLSGNPIRILGELREEQEPGAIPDIPLNALLPSSPQILTSAPSNSPTLHGSLICNGPFVCTGNLKLEGANLYVKGNLDVGGELQGSGTLTVEGSTHLRGSANLSSLGRVALVSQGDITLEGAGSTRSYFKGIVYTRGKLSAHGILVYGCLLGAAPGPASGAQLDLQDCVVLQDSGPLTEGNSAVQDAYGTLYMARESTNARAESVQVSLQLRGDRIHFIVSELRYEGVVAVTSDPKEFDVTPEDQLDIKRFLAELDKQYPEASRLYFGPKEAPDPRADPMGTGPQADLHFYDPRQPLNEGLLTLKDQLGKQSSTADPMFDLNQFLRANERLRIASCRTLP